MRQTTMTKMKTRTGAAVTTGATTTPTRKIRPMERLVVLLPPQLRLWALALPLEPLQRLRLTTTLMPMQIWLPLRARSLAVSAFIIHRCFCLRAGTNINRIQSFRLMPL